MTHAVRHAGLAAFGIAALQACSSPAKAPVAEAPRVEATAAPAGADGAGRGNVVGQAPVPGSNGVVVVVLEPKETRTFPPSGEAPVMDQASLTFTPDVLLVRTGEPVEFRNSDETLHNVHVGHEEDHTLGFNVAIPTGESYRYTFTRAGFYHVGCDIHPEMSATVFASASPYAMLADGDGQFAFTGVPFGAWTLTVRAGSRTLHQDVTVASGVTHVTLE
jgi:plastocyanin